MKTYSRADWSAAQDAWTDFSEEWRDLRHRMAMQGVLFPPSGDRFDSWDDDNPSQRAVLIRAIRETPAILDRCVKGATSWSQVIDRLLRRRDSWREEQAERIEVEPRPTHREAAQSIASILGRIAVSAGIDHQEPS